MCSENCLSSPFALLRLPSSSPCVSQLAFLMFPSEYGQMFAQVLHSSLGKQWSLHACACVRVCVKCRAFEMGIALTDVFFKASEVLCTR